MAVILTFTCKYEMTVIIIDFEFARDVAGEMEFPELFEIMFSPHISSSKICYIWEDVGG